MCCVPSGWSGVSRADTAPPDRGCIFLQPERCLGVPLLPVPEEQKRKLLLSVGGGYSGICSSSCLCAGSLGSHECDDVRDEGRGRVQPQAGWGLPFMAHSAEGAAALPESPAQKTPGRLAPCVTLSCL